jgi:quercetin dioxygenase-like cupin family protein
MKFAIATTAGAEWRPSDHGSLEKRDLLLETATSGQMRAIDLRARDVGGFGGWPETRSATFIFFYVIEGGVRFDMDDGTIIELGRREAVHLPFLRHVVGVRHSGDLRAAEVRAPGSVHQQALVPLLQIWSSEESADWESMVVRNRPELFIPGNGPRAFFTYRDLGTARITERRIHIHDGDGAKKPMAGGTGWHNHSMSQLFYVLDGEATVSVEGYGTHHMVAGDTMMIGKRMSHNVSTYSEGYNVFEICLPADYDTVDQPAPNAFAEAGN